MRWTRITSSTTIISNMRGTLLALLVCTTIQAQEWAKARLEKSPRHHEQVAVQQNGRAIATFVVYPDTKDKRPVVLLIHDSAGPTDWFKNLADEVAAMGYVALAPDLKSSQNNATPDLNAVADFAKKLPVSNGTLFVAGIGWGGEQSFRFATDRPDVAAALVFCGASPDKASIARIKGTIFGFYAGNDQGVNATVPPAQAAAK